MKNNKKIISEISRLHELMGVKSNLLNEQPIGVLDDVLKKIAPDIFKAVDSPIAQAYRKMANKQISDIERKQGMEEFIRLSKTEMPELYAQIRRIALDDSEIKAVIDNLFTSEQKQTFSNNVETLLKRGDTDEEVMSQYKNSINRSDLTQSERAALEQRMRDEISTIRTRLVDSGEIAPLADDAASTVTQRTRITDDPTTPKTGDEVADDAAKTGDEVADDAAKAGDEAVTTGENPVDNFTPEEITQPQSVTLDELTARKMEDIPNLTDEEMQAFMKDPKWYNFIKRIQNGTTIADMFTSQIKLMEQSQKIMNELLNNKNLGSVAKRNLEARLNRNMLSLANYKSNQSYLDFYRWADDLFSSSTDKNVKKWWAATKKKDGFVIMSELEKRGPWYKQFGTGFSDGWKSMKQSTIDMYARVRQAIVQTPKKFVNGIAKLRGKNPPFDITKATDAQKKAFKRYFWTGNASAYEGFSKYMAENGFIAASSRLLGQFGRGYLIASAYLTALEVVLQGGLEGDAKGIYNENDSVMTKAWKMSKALFSEYWDNILGMKYAVPAWTLGKPVWDLLASICDAWFASGGDVLENFQNWATENIPFYSGEANTALEENPNNTNEVPTTGDEESTTGDENSATEEPETSTEDSNTPNTLAHAKANLASGVTQEGEYYILDGDKYKWNPSTNQYEWIEE